MSLTKNWSKPATLFALLAALALLGSCAPKPHVSPELLEGPGWTRVDNNLHRIEGPDGPERAFRVYRSGAPSPETFARWCEVYGVERVIVMSGDAGSHELKYQSEGVCPGIEVLYNVTQRVETPLSDGFLKYFDAEVERARADGVGLLFRCHTGSHRAGRLAAYYQMKYQGLTAEQAITVMDYNGMLMPLFDPALRPQVRALDDYLQGRPCSQPANACVLENSDKWVKSGPE